MKLKRILLSMLMFCLLMGVPMYVNAEGTVDDSAASTVSGDYSHNDGSSVKWELTNGTLTISGNGKMYMNNDLNDKEVPWSVYKDEIQNIVIEEGVTSVSTYAFYNHSNVTSVTLPESLETIGWHAFHGCTSLTSIVIPDNVTSMSQYVFGYCTALTDVTLGASINSIPEYTFAQCSSLTNVKVPSNVTYIGKYAFWLCSDLVSIDLSSASSLENICQYAFQGCTGLAEIWIPETVINIQGYAFRSCGNLKTIYFNGDAPTIDGYAFSKVTADAYYPADNATWTEDMLKDYDGTITWHATSGGDCSADGSNVKWSLNNGTLTIYGNGAMCDYESLSDVPWGDLATRDKITSIVVEEGVTHIGNYALRMNGNATSVNLPDTLESIGEYGFSYCMALESITIPVNVTSIGLHAFGDCLQLKEIHFKGDAPAFQSCVFYNVTADAYYPAGNTTWTSDKLQDYEGTITWHAIGNLADQTVALAYTTTEYTGSAKKPAVTIRGLILGTDYTVSYSNNVNAGTATVKIQGIGDYTGTVTKTFTITKVPSTKLSATLARTSQAYTSPAVALPGVTVKNASGKKLVSGTDYTVTYPNNLKNPGSYTIKIVCKGNYTGTINKAFKIVPKGTSISKLTKATKAFTAKWKKQATQTTGYQIQYSTSKSFSSGVKSAMITKNSTTSKKITRLKAKKTYYVRVRTYKTVSGVKYYSSWSTVKSVKTK